MSQKIYFDESGFTGTNLLNQNQTVYTYAAIGLNETRADEIIKKIRANYPTQAPELKFKNYSKYLSPSKCEEFCLFVIDLLKNCSGVVVFDKKFALCAKFFEYMFEPVIANVNWHFYEANFHLYIAYKIYKLLGDISQTPLLVDFENVMKQKDKATGFNQFLNAIRPSLSVQRKSHKSFIEKVYIFVSLNKTLIHEELQDLSGETPTDKYILDLTSTAFLTLSAFMTEKFKAIEPIYDESKMMDAHKDIFDGFIGRELKFDVPFFNQKFNVYITKPLVSGNSLLEPSLQLADLLAGATSYAYSNQNGKIIDALINNRLIASAIIPRTIEMEIVNLYPNQYEKILDILVKRSIANKPLFDYEIYRLLRVLSESCKEVLKIHNERIEGSIKSQTF